MPKLFLHILMWNGIVDTSEVFTENNGLYYWAFRTYWEFYYFFGEVNPFSCPMKQGLAVKFLLKEEMTQRN